MSEGVELPIVAGSSEPDAEDPEIAVEIAPDTAGCDSGRPGEGETLPSGMCNRRATFWA
jgi:hypothetical protein